MNNIFNINRFGKYLVYDLNNARNNYGLSMLVVGLIPVIFFVISGIFNFIFDNIGIGLNDFDRFFAFFIGYCTTIVAFPAKTYGFLTDRRAGSSWILLPASGFEKWLSMIIISTIVVPACYLALFMGSDELLHLIFKNYGDSLISKYSELKTMLELNGAPENMISIPFVIYLSGICNILFFLLGAIWFKKSKIAKTILAGIVLSIVLSTIGSKIIMSTDFFDLCNDKYLGGAFEFMQNLKLFAYTTTGIEAVLLAGLIAARIKTIKH